MLYKNAVLLLYLLNQLLTKRMKFSRPQMKEKLAGVLLLAFLVPNVVAAQSLREQIDAQLDALTAGIAVLIEAISTSGEISDSEKLTLLQQTIVLSTAILDVRSVLFDRDATVEDLNTPDNLPSHMVAFFDVTDQTAVVEVAYDGTGTTTYEYTNLFDPVAVTDFDDQLEIVRTELVSQVSEELGLSVRTVLRNLLFSGFNPERVDGVAPNSALAEDLADEFGKASIIERVFVSPGQSGPGTITFLSDQGEWLVLSLDRDGQIGDADTTYVYSYEAYIPEITDGFYNPEGGESTYEPVSSAESNNIPQEDMSEFLQILFNRTPFSSAIPDFNIKLQSFLMDNSNPECPTAFDQEVMRGYVDFLSSGRGLQHYPIVDIATFGDPFAEPGIVVVCEDPQQYF